MGPKLLVIYNKCDMVYFCDFTIPAQKIMDELDMTNDDVQLIFNEGMSEGQNRKFIDRDGNRMGILFHYDGYTLRYVIESVYKRPLVSNYAKKVAAKNEKGS